MENKQWTRGEDLREFVFNGSYEMWTSVVFAVYAVSECNAYLFPDLRNIEAENVLFHSRWSKLSPCRFLKIELKIACFYNFPFKFSTYKATCKYFNIFFHYIWFYEYFCSLFLYTTFSSSTVLLVVNIRAPLDTILIAESK